MEREIIKEKVSLTKIYRFSAAHRLYIEELSDEENFRIFNKCSNPNGHGHDYVVEVRFTGEINKETGMVMKPEVLDKEMEVILNELDHTRLDCEIPFFKENQSTGENIVKFLWEKLSEHIGNKLSYIKVWENNRSYFEYFEEDQR